MERLARQNQTAPILIRQPVVHQGEIEIFVGSIELFADERMADVSEVNPNLMLAARLRLNLQQGEVAFRPGEAT